MTGQSRRTVAEAAVAGIAARLGRYGQWRGESVLEHPASHPQRDVAAPLTALGVLALQGLDLPGVAAVVARSREHVRLTMLPDGMWRYYRTIPPDTDDTAMCALALGIDDPAVRRLTTPALAATRCPDGRFPTWTEPGWAAVVDAVANAHVVAVLGAGDATAAAIAWLDDVVASGAELAASTYYPDALDLHVALTRAVRAGVRELRPAVEAAAVRARDRLRDADLSPYRTAQAVVVAAEAARRDGMLATELHRAAGRLLDARIDAARWAPETLFVATDTETGLRRLYRSEEVVTALCVRALAAAGGT